MIEEILAQVSFKTIAIAVIGAFALLHITEWLNKERKIRALGGHGRRNPTWYPFGKNLLLTQNSALT